MTPEADPCEWYPAEGRPATTSDPSHGDATVSLDGGEWHLCARCAELPAFARFRVRKPLLGARGSS
jgi:hypothetical protein